MNLRNATAWQDESLPEFPKLESPADFDVVVIGGGITGVTAAWLLKQAGKTVCLLERGRLANVDTGLTTAHLTYVTDARLSELVSTFGKDGARLAWQGGAAAINTIEGIARAQQIDCEFRRIPGFLHASLQEDRNEEAELQREADLARELGFAATFLDSVPYVNCPGVQFANQAKFHPLKYLSGLARKIPGDGSAIYEQSELEEVQSQPLTVQANGQTIRCGFVVLATHTPLVGKSSFVGATLFQSKLALYSTYVLGAAVSRNLLPEASFWDTSDPYYYLRVDAGDSADYLIFGGEDHKTGQEPYTDDAFARLENVLRGLVPEARLDRRWSGQVIETHDGLPYIGNTAPDQFVATGYAGNGTTFGTLAAMMACDAALKRENPWSDLFHPRRKTLRAGWDYLRENFDYPYYLIGDRLRRADTASMDEIAPGEGKLLTLEGQRVACSRDEHGKLQMVSAVCTHMGCLVHWNHAEQTWDCPCHGSRFKPTGEVMAGPAESPLEAVEEPVPAGT
jgi:glycine/D-amino acid oxidase-like deaminating enzyme/nitrite reductase/ring-hydroxylating ferredoxin subunit